ncbi:MAG TPA: thermonuclease family protein [Caulobacteraceae bacterium]|jgi:endonuclease YncB( thermonuclease family)|nr:thermonuclease family protein [Caulobacteraceae bacterium]
MRRLLIAWTLIAAALAGCGEGGGLDRLSAGERGRVVSVRSGDELVLDSGLDVRLAGVETPWMDEPGGPGAQAYLNSLALGREVQLFYGGARRDPRARALAQVRLDDGRTWVEGAQLRAGWARVRTFADNRALAAPMLSDEAHARRAKLGLWALPDYEVRLPQEVGRDMRGYQIVEGRVVSVTPARGGTYLDFNRARSGFAAVIDPHAVGDLAAAGLAPADLVGRLIRVRGMVGWDGLMRIDHPEPIELLKER